MNGYSWVPIKLYLKKSAGSRLTNSKGLADTKGEGWRRTGEEGGRRGLRGIMISTHGVEGIMGKTV